jgi:hypothetical protein
MGTRRTGSDDAGWEIACACPQVCGETQTAGGGASVGITTRPKPSVRDGLRAGIPQLEDHRPGRETSGRQAPAGRIGVGSRSGCRRRALPDSRLCTARRPQFA